MPAHQLQPKRFIRLLSWVLGLAIAPAIVLLFSNASAQQKPMHPLDELTEAEVQTLVATLRSDRKIDDQSRFAVVRLNPPPKAEVWKWQPGQPLPPREAFVAIKQGAKTYEGVVDVSASQVLSWQEVKDRGEPVLMWGEYETADELLKADPRWQVAMAKRGIFTADYKNVACEPLSGTSPLGYRANQRLIVLPCALDTEDQNLWGHPIEGVVGIIDLNQKTVLAVMDESIAPIPRHNTGINPQSILKRVGRLRQRPLPLSINQPQGASFKVKGHQVNWQNWQFHFRMDPRVGLVVDTVTYNDNGRSRKIMYEGSLGEAMAHYGAPSVSWYNRNFLDAADFDMGRLASQLQPERDCPMNAQFFSTVFTDETGEPYTQEQVACLFEERGEGGVEWRHYEDWHETTHARSRRNLVLRYISTVGNYDYIFDWRFQQNGAIRVAVGASGPEALMAVSNQTVADDPNGENTRYGTLVDPNLIGVTHQHLYNFRLDLDVDGLDNTALESVTKSVPAPDSPKKTAMVLERQLFKTEQAARRPYDMMALWQVVNPEVKNRNGYPVGYALQPKGTTKALLDLDSLPEQRFGFLRYSFWVTPYNPREFYPDGEYAIGADNAEGLMRWTQANRPIENQDIVVWYTFGNTHVVRPEEWPILPVDWVFFTLKPFNFFDHTPSLDVPEYH